MTGRHGATRTEKRAAMGTRAAETPKAARGRTGPSATPVVLRQGGATDARIPRDWVRERLGTALGRFARRIDRVTVNIRDESGPHGRPTVRATVTLQVTVGTPVVVTARAGTSRQAVAAAIRAAERAVRRRTQRTRGR